MKSITTHPKQNIPAFSLQDYLKLLWKKKNGGEGEFYKKAYSDKFIFNKYSLTQRTQWKCNRIIEQFSFVKSGSSFLKMPLSQLALGLQW